MADLAFAPQHNMISYLEKTKSNIGFHQILEFLTSSSIHHSLTISPTICASNIERFWNFATSQTINDEKQINAIVYGKTVVITKSSMRRDLLFTDANGITCLTNEQIFENFLLIGNMIRKSEKSSRTFTPLFATMLAPPAVVEGGGDSLVRATTTTSLDAQQDSSNITKIQSKATLNEPTPQGEGSGSGPGRQETIGGAMTQIRFEGALIQSIDPPLSTGYTVRSREDRMEHEIELTDPISQTPHDLPLLGENVKTAKAKEISSLKKRVTKLKQRQSSRFLCFQPFNVGSSKSHSLGRRKDADIEIIVKDKGNGEKGGSTSETISTARPDISAARQEVSTAELKTPPTIATLFDDEDVTIVDTLVKMKNQKAKEKGIAFKDADDSARPIRSITTLQPLPTIDLKDKDLNEEAKTERERQEEASKAAPAKMYDEKYTVEERSKLLAEFFERRRKQLVKEKSEAGSEEDEKRIGGRNKKAAGSSLKHKSPKKQKVNDQESKDSDKEHRKCLKVVSNDDKAIDYETLDVKSLIVDFLDRQDVLDLPKIIMERFPANDPEGYDLILWGDLKTLVKSCEDDEICRNQQDWKLLSWMLYGTRGIHTLMLDDSSVSINMFV
uniref:Xylulose kinase-1 n=1 Tax=Tanacetum cinerariifolium TaxID=118510 RepID=A0A6L2JZY9_TANCI|nr:hypothetical protein [Tanacetum cinerariifolium]